jgi:Na+-driven multidrug efflux pump
MNSRASSTRQAPPSKTNTLSLGIICVLILVLTMQVWLLTAALNESLEGNNAVKWPAFIASTVLFLAGAALLRYLPDPVRRARKAARHQRDTAGL